MDFIKNYQLMKKQIRGLYILAELLKSSEEFHRHRLDYAKEHNWKDVDQIQVAWLVTNRWNNLVQHIVNGECSKWEDT